MGIVLVTGGAGFLGSHVVDHLLQRGHRVRVLDNLSTGSLRNLQAAADRQCLPGDVPAGAARGPRPGPRLELMIGDIRDENLVRKAMQRVECVFHMAAVPAGVCSSTAATETHMVNVHGTLNVLQAATGEGVRRVVFASCASVYGTPETLPIGEDSAPQPVSVFGASKLGGEIYCRAYQRAHHLETVALRYLTVYGPRQNGIKDGAIVPTLVETLRSNRRPTIFGDGRAAHDFLYVDDAVAATLAAADSPEAAGQAINIGSGQLASVMEVLDILNRLLRTDLVPRVARARTGQVPPIRAEVRLAERLLGCAPRVSLVSGLARAVQFYAEQDEEAVLAEVGPSGAA